MVAIETRYLGPTDTKGSRIVATDANGGRVVVGYSDALHVDDAHNCAALALLKKRGWGGLWVRGGSKHGSVYVCVQWGDSSSPARILGPREEVAIVTPA